MAEITKYAPGSFCWVDSGTTDLGMAQGFYRSIFGWEYRTVEDDYTMCLLERKPVAGLYPLAAELTEMGAGPYWLPYVAVADAQATMARARELGADPMGGVFEVVGRGKGGAFTDPTGGLCGFFEPRGHLGSALKGEQGTLAWTELQTHDVARAGAFYSALFGWRPQSVEMEGGTYTVFQQGGENQAGMMAITPTMDEVSPNWAVYFFADDVDATAAAVGAAGGAVVVPPTPVSTWGRMATLRSADGAHFSILHAEPM
jgi:predicted enzyme related to lactoylglutathione lyase